jgi:HD-like signal output (HDOD) protein
MTYMTTKEVLLKNLENLDKMPSIPVVVAPLLRYLEQPVDQLDVQKVVSLLAQDKSLTAQSLHMANSPLFGHWQTIDSLKGAVVSLGFQRLRDIVISCSVLRLMPLGESKINPVVFWEHSLGCALVCRHFAREIAFPHPEKAYLGGLLHDLGILVNLWILPQELAAQLITHKLSKFLFSKSSGRCLASRTAKLGACSPSVGALLLT